MHSEYENLTVLSSFYFHFQQPWGKDRETQRWRETNLKRREKRFVFLLCGPVWLWRSSMPHCHPPSFPSVQSLLQPVSRKCPPSWHRHPHTHQKQAQQPAWDHKMKTFNKLKIEVCLSSFLEEKQIYIISESKVFGNWREFQQVVQLPVTYLLDSNVKTRNASLRNVVTLIVSYQEEAVQYAVFCLTLSFFK